MYEGGSVMKTELVYPFTTSETPELAQVGGKAMSLILMTRQGFPVPPGFVLSVAFFEPWLEHIVSTPDWTKTLNSSPKDLKRNSMMLKALCLGLELDHEQNKALAEALEYLEPDGETPLFAVRSSSPEEDLEELSFAGGYETTLGVTREVLKDALRLLLRRTGFCIQEGTWPRGRRATHRGHCPAADCC